MSNLEIALVLLVPATTLGFIHYAIPHRLPRFTVFAIGVGIIALTVTGLWANNQQVASWVVVAWFWMAAASAGLITAICYGMDELRAKSKKIADQEARLNVR